MSKMLKLFYKGTYLGRNYYICQVRKHYTAYVGVLPTDTKAYGISDYVINDTFDFGCNGGITYSRSTLAFPEGDLYKDDSWFIGWDYNHYKDYNEELCPNGKVWMPIEIEEECLNVIRALDILKDGVYEDLEQ